MSNRSTFAQIIRFYLRPLPPWKPPPVSKTKAKIIEKILILKKDGMFTFLHSAAIRFPDILYLDRIHQLRAHSLVLPWDKAELPLSDARGNSFWKRNDNQKKNTQVQSLFEITNEWRRYDSIRADNHRRQYDPAFRRSAGTAAKKDTISAGMVATYHILLCNAVNVVELIQVRLVDWKIRRWRDF